MRRTKSKEAIELYNDMDLKNYIEMPDEGVYEKIEQRLVLRRWLRVGGIMLATMAVVGAGMWLLSPRNEAADSSMQTVAVVQQESMLEMPEETVALQQTEATTLSTVASNHNEVVPPTNHPLPTTPLPATPLPATRYQLPEPQPVLPSPSVKPAQNEMAELILEPQATEPATATTQSAKSGETPTPTPHVDNVLWAPNAIAPGFDDDAVREFKLVATSAVTDFRLIIVNRGGRQVFSTSNINEAWDGTMDGHALPQGAYVWVARFRDTAGNMRQERGTVTLIR